MKKILVVGQTPPPYGGQAQMIEYLLKGAYEKIQLYHVRMCFSKEMNELGRFSLYKVYHLLTIIFKILKVKFKHKIDILYYPPSSSPPIAVFRDCLILFFVRPFFKKIIFHFHAAGISEELPKYRKPLQWIIYRILRNPDFSITSSTFNPKDGEYLHSKETAIIPLGIDDLNPQWKKKEYMKDGLLNILFVGLMNSTKGEKILLDAVGEIVSKGYAIHLHLAGKFLSDTYQAFFFEEIKRMRLEGNITYHGVVSGERKERLFLSSDVFCFPSFFSSESFGVVLLEAMMYQLPIITTNWRGLRSVVEEGKNGVMVDIKSVSQVVDKLEYFCLNPDKLAFMGKNARLIYEGKYTIDRYRKAINEAFDKI
ncbi:glycosyltransferase family 4 protein [uncultured Phocaeicola sp.]|uniref:glycosyltransferase family 4 protein n=1 Tax=uncultured Phocaeicola sp. TaxID=990718 RepID=UPI0014349D16|nr:glycosyltransferase family 4 protein [uncultured Phocaeicola sp.]GFI00786.1 spore coat protein SA [Bacteroidaceae bacterium]